MAVDELQTFYCNLYPLCIKARVLFYRSNILMDFHHEWTNEGNSTLEVIKKLIATLVIDY